MPETILPDHGREHQYRPPTAGPPTRDLPELEAQPRAARARQSHRGLRARRGLSQEQLGHAARLHRNYVGAIERGEINPSFRVLLKLCVRLRLPLTEIVAVFERQRETLGGPYQPPASGTDT